MNYPQPQKICIDLQKTAYLALCSIEFSVWNYNQFGVGGSGVNLFQIRSVHANALYCESLVPVSFTSLKKQKSKNSCAHLFLIIFWTGEMFVKCETQPWMELHFQLQLQNKDNTFDEPSKQLINIYYWRQLCVASCVHVSNSQRRCITLWEPTNQSDPLSHCSCQQNNNKLISLTHLLLWENKSPVFDFICVYLWAF